MAYSSWIESTFWCIFLTYFKLCYLLALHYRMSHTKIHISNYFFPELHQNEYFLILTSQRLQYYGKVQYSNFWKTKKSNGFRWKPLSITFSRRYSFTRIKNFYFFLYTYKKKLCKFQVGRCNGFKMATFFVEAEIRKYLKFDLFQYFIFFQYNITTQWQCRRICESSCNVVLKGGEVWKKSKI